MHGNESRPQACGPEIIIIAALACNRAIGRGNRLLYRLTSDMRRFRSLTLGNTVLMGRRTFESLPKGALPLRRNIVLSRSAGTAFPGCEAFPSLGEALAACTPGEKVYVIGGASVYAKTVGLASRMALTLVYDTPENADAFFPAFDASLWKEERRERHTADEGDEKDFDFVDYVRI